MYDNKVLVLSDHDAEKMLKPPKLSKALRALLKKSRLEYIRSCMKDR
jgi:hypothetical protein